MPDFLFRGGLSDLDPDVFELSQFEAERQYRKLILIPSESSAPQAVREALSSTFQNLYAEGYPDEDTRWMNEQEILNYPAFLAHYRRYADPRYYKGVEYADIVEALARRRCAEAFSTPKISADQIFVNVQPLSGAPANNAVYHALINPGDTILGMNLLHGGHLTHGSSVNRSGKLYHVIHYNVNPVTEQIDYEAVEALALENKPKVIIAGYSSYPWVPDWERFRKIADAAGAYLLADISHIAGLVAGKVIPSPIGIAHVITFTTHKTLCGPRGACILTTDASLSRKIDKAVFPGEQGGPHVHVFAALATTFKIAQTEKFRRLQKQIVENCRVLTQQLAIRGLRIPFGGTNTHMANLDCKTISGKDGTPLSGDMAARILDIAGIVLNRNTIPGDKTALNASGIRFGTPWVTQRGLDIDDMKTIADIMANILQATTPYSVETRQGVAQRAKADYLVLEQAKIQTRDLAEKAGLDFQPSRHGYPHFYYKDDHTSQKSNWTSLEIKGENARPFLNYSQSSNLDTLTPGKSQKSSFHTPEFEIEAVVTSHSYEHYQVSLPAEQAIALATWLRDLSDGYIGFDTDVTRRLAGPVTVNETATPPVQVASEVPGNKPYYIGIPVRDSKILPEFKWVEKEPAEMKRTPLFETHKKMGAKMVPFAGWEMPVWYTSVVDEHLATRKAAGLFDVSHMGVYQVEGPDAAIFLDCVCGNDILALAVGESCYTHFMDPDANVIDDTLVYRRTSDKFLVVVNASNDDKDWAWLNAVLNGNVRVDNTQTGASVFGQNAILRNLRDHKAGDDMRVDIALQGPRSRDILLTLNPSPTDRKKIMALKRTELCEAVVGGFNLIVSRTGYTGERMAFELFVHPDQVVALWKALLSAGEPAGIKPCGLGARDSLRTEAGLPLYGHEMGGDLNLSISEAGFLSYVKTYKPWFIGREAYITKENERKGVVIRFRFLEKGVRMSHNGDPVLDKKGRVIGQVTSCAIDGDGFLTGQAFIETKSAEERTPIFIFQGAPKDAGKSPAQLKSGERVILPGMAEVISRFPKLA